MAHHTHNAEPAPSRAFMEQAGRARSGLVAEFWDFIRYYKIWWLTPVILAILLVGALVVMSGTAAAPFIYALF